jgi:hypothetical protein
MKLAEKSRSSPRGSDTHHTIKRRSYKCDCAAIYWKLRKFGLKTPAKEHKALSFDLASSCWGLSAHAGYMHALTKSAFAKGVLMRWHTDA